jgi:cysteine desulfurase
MPPRIYLDANATEPLRPEARAAMLAALDITGNPASVHADGRAARRVVEDARERLAARFGGAASRLVFCSGGTEADALAVHGLSEGRRVLIGATEHDAIRAAAPDAEGVAVDGDGVVRLDALAAALARPGRALVCLMLANNETGTLQPIAEVAALCRAHGALLHVDAVQAAGRMAVEFAALGASSMALSSHKMGGPAGVGALLLDAPADGALRPLIRGGGQERGHRGGTPAVAAIAGFAAAADAPPADLQDLRDQVEREAVACGALVAGAGARRLGNTSCLMLPGVAAQTQLIALDLDGIAVSAGAACSSGKVARSHVLAAMGLGALAEQAVRVSLPWNACAADVAGFAAAYGRLALRVRRAA